MVATPDGALSVQVPPGATADVVTMSLNPVDPLTSAANLQVGGRFYALPIGDTSGNPVESFDQPLTLVVVLPPDADPTSVPISALDPSAGAMVGVDSVVQPDGTLAAQFTSLAPPTNLTAAAPED
jgi:hypothetical protein